MTPQEYVHALPSIRHAVSRLLAPVPGRCRPSRTSADATSAGPPASSRTCRAATGRPSTDSPLHYYTDFRQTRSKPPTSTPKGWYDVLLKGIAHRKGHSKITGPRSWANSIPQHHTKFVVDEWGVWYKPGEEIAPATSSAQPITLRDALHTALTFDIFNRHADKIAMANVAQTINCIHSLFLAQGDRSSARPSITSSKCIGRT